MCVCALSLSFSFFPSVSLFLPLSATLCTVTNYYVQYSMCVCMYVCIYTWIWHSFSLNAVNYICLPVCDVCYMLAYILICLWHRMSRADPAELPQSGRSVWPQSAEAGGGVGGGQARGPGGLSEGGGAKGGATEASGRDTATPGESETGQCRDCEAYSRPFNASPVTVIRVSLS